MTAGAFFAGWGPAGDGRVHLLCHPYAGGGAGAYPELVGLAEHGITVLPTRLPGRDTRLHEPPIVDIARLVPAMAAEAYDRPGPLAVFGHSVGALVAFELTRRLEQLGAPPVMLIVSGSRPPGPPGPGDPAELPPDDSVLDGVRRLGGLPDEVWGHPQLRQMLAANLRTDLAVRRSYAADPAATVGVPLVALTGRADPIAAPDEVAGWARHTRAPFSRHVLAGGHFYFRTDPGPLRSLLIRLLEPVREVRA
jgi:medium-chain acyl-[acyl-carrier-protein] hydrolase